MSYLLFPQYSQNAVFIPVIPHFQDQLTPQEYVQYGVPHGVLFTPSLLYKDMADDRSRHIINTFFNQPDVPNVANKKVEAVTQTVRLSLTLASLRTTVRV